MPKIAIFVGTRPEIIKMAPIIWELGASNSPETSIVHTGQHYDWEMSERFLRELRVPTPDRFLGVGSGDPGQQVSKVIASTEAYLKRKRPDLVVVEGDTNSALGVALASSKSNVRLAHVEAGCRCFDNSVPEEINRVLIADCADLNLAPTQNCVKNLQNEGIKKNRIRLTGHPIVTLLKELKSEIILSSILRRLRLKKLGYILATAHRQENVDNPTRLRRILTSLGRLPNTVIMPLHPRTGKNVRRFKLLELLNPLHTTPPLGYLDTLRLVRDARLVITDSGGLQQEAFLLGTPCLTIRRATEWIETIVKGGNFLIENPDGIGEAYEMVLLHYDSIRDNITAAGDIFGDASSAARISRELLKKRQ